jgi:putative toxin-antitoxin system antitoxin component (TIGR02293 family)
MSLVANLPFVNSRTAILDLFELPTTPISNQIAVIEHGLPGSALAAIAKNLGIAKQRILAGLNLSQRTVAERERTQQRFSEAESERLLRLLRVRTLARLVFSTNEAVAEWLSTPDHSLRDKAPLDMLRTDLGTTEVENLIRAMAHGVPV